MTLRGDRVEFTCSDFDNAKGETAATILEGLWAGLKSLSDGAVPKTHSFLFEIDLAILGRVLQFSP